MLVRAADHISAIVVIVDGLQIDLASPACRAITTRTLQKRRGRIPEVKAIEAAPIAARAKHMGVPEHVYMQQLNPYMDLGPGAWLVVKRVRLPCQMQ